MRKKEVWMVDELQCKKRYQKGTAEVENIQGGAAKRPDRSEQRYKGPNNDPLGHL